MIFTLSSSTPQKILSRVQDLFYIVPSESLVIQKAQTQQFCDFQNVLQMKPKFVLEQLFPWIVKWKGPQYRTKYIIYGYSKKVLPIYKTYPILKIIQHVDFQSLSQLYLSVSNLSSIEGLAFMNMPNLTIVELKRNFITSLKPLSKLNLPHLDSVNLSKNLFSAQQLRYFTQIYLGSTNGKKKHIQTQGQNTGILFRLQIFGNYQTVNIWLFKFQVIRRIFLSLSGSIQCQDHRHRTIYTQKMRQKINQHFYTS